MNDDQLRSAFRDLLQDLPADRPLPAATASRVRRRRQLKVGAGAIGGVGALVAAAVLVLGVSSPPQDELDQAGPPPSPSASPSTSPSTAPSSSPSTSPSSSPSAPAAVVRVVLRPDGLGLADGGSSTSALTFGTDADTVRTALDAALGQGGEQPTPDCGEGSSTVQYERIFLLLQDGRFVGWVTGSPGPTTGDGIGVGSTLAELRAALAGVSVTETTLGVEWSTVEGGLAGFLDGTDESSLVNSMAGGVRCLAR